MVLFASLVNAILSHFAFEYLNIDKAIFNVVLTIDLPFDTLTNMKIVLTLAVFTVLAACKFVLLF